VLAQRKYGVFLAEKGCRPADAELYLLKALELECNERQEVDPNALLHLVNCKNVSFICLFSFKPSNKTVLDARGDTAIADGIAQVFQVR
jgi:hypothetical protein